MKTRISPLWWPLLVGVSPLLIPLLYVRNTRFLRDAERAERLNQARLAKAASLKGSFEMTELDFVELTVLVEEKAEEGFLGDAGVSYLFRSDCGSLLYDVGFGPSRPALEHNSRRLGIGPEDIKTLVISHLHLDHMGGMKAQRKREVRLSRNLSPDSQNRDRTPCYLPDAASAPGFQERVVEEPQQLGCGFASTGLLARSLFFLGFTEEQALIARIMGKGLLVFTGCGHQGIPLLLRYVKALCKEPIYALGGGMHFPVTEGRGNRMGVQLQQIAGTGKPPWKRITMEDLDETIAAINNAGVKKVFLSGHDSCDFALARLREQLEAETVVLKAGGRYTI
jgi:7,8-dihydropterin-6-yl-methyl-4-(beta-D-ribofuranosyl)aminobenzene 5'-phosphate synthase